MQFGQYQIADYLITLSSCTNPVRHNIIFRFHNMIIGKHPVDNQTVLSVINKRLARRDIDAIDRIVQIGDRLLFNYWHAQPYWYLFKVWKKNLISD